MVSVKLTQPVYEQILIHMLQYGNKNLRKSEEAMGLCYGIRSGDKIEIKKVVPIKHGASCEKTFTETDFVVFTEFDQKMIADGLEPFGFYNTHPKTGFYLSQNEMKNLLYYLQDKKNPYAVVIIGDHMQLEEANNLGIKALKLKDASKGASSDFEVVPLEVDPPAGMSLLKTTKFLIEQAQKRQPYLEEQGAQLKAEDSLWDSMGDTDTAEDKIMKKMTPMMSALKPDSSNLDQSFFVAGLKAYNTFMDEVTQLATKVLNDPSSDLIAMRTAIEDGLRNVTKWFKSNLTIQGQKMLKDFEGTINMVAEGNHLDEKAIKSLLIALNDEYVRLTNLVKK